MKIHGTKNSYRWVPMISGHRTEKLFSMGFEILGLDPAQLTGISSRDTYKTKKILLQGG